MPGEDRFAQAQELLDAGTPKAWVWDEDGRRVVGEVVNAQTLSTQYQDSCPVLTLKLHDGTLRTVWGTGVLDDKFRRLAQEGLAMGDIIGVERSGLKERSRTGNEYWGFQVVRVPGPNAVSQGMFGGGPSQALPPQVAEVERELQAEVVGEEPGW